MAKRKAQAPKGGSKKGRTRAAKATRKVARKTKRASSTRPKARSARKTSKPAKRASARPRRGSGQAKKAVRRTARPAARRAKAPAKAARKSPSQAATPVIRATSRRAPTLDRERRTVHEEEMVPSPPSSLDMNRSASAARTGRAELKEKLQKHTSTGPALTAGDVDADWEAAESVGDEAPGGDNPTPDQDVVDEIGKALGVEYDDDEELQGGDEIIARDRKRWELDPASKDDFDDRDE